MVDGDDLNIGFRDDSVQWDHRALSFDDYAPTFRRQNTRFELIA